MSFVLLSFLLIIIYLFTNVDGQNLSNILQDSNDINNNYINYLRLNSLTINLENKCIVMIIKFNYSMLEFNLHTQDEKNLLFNFTKDGSNINLIKKM